MSTSWEARAEREETIARGPIQISPAGADGDDDDDEDDPLPHCRSLSSRRTPAVSSTADSGGSTPSAASRLTRAKPGGLLLAAVTVTPPSPGATVLPYSSHRRTTKPCQLLPMARVPMEAGEAPSPLPAPPAAAAADAPLPPAGASATAKASVPAPCPPASALARAGAPPAPAGRITAHSTGPGRTMISKVRSVNTTAPAATVEEGEEEEDDDDDEDEVERPPPVLLLPLFPALAPLPLTT